MKKNSYCRRWSDVVNSIFIPASFILLIYVTFLTRSINVLNNSFIDFSLNEAAVADVGRLASIPVMIPTSEKLLEPPINLTSLSTPHVLRFTAVQRAGSTTMEQLLGELGVDRDFSMLEKEPTFNDDTLLPDSRQRKEIVSSVSAIEDDVVSFDKYGFIDFSEFSEKQPIYASMVRFPVQRAISQYYAERSSAILVQKRVNFPDKFVIPDRKYLMKSLETCLNNIEDTECDYKKGKHREGHLIQYFCGHDKICINYGDPDGLKKAKENVEKIYSVVGIAEDMNKTLVVLENFIPRYFTGAYEVYYNSIFPDSSRLNKNDFKPMIEPWVIEILEDKLDIEIEFYQFLRQRLNRQYEALLQRKKESAVLK